MNKHIIITPEQAEQIKGRYGKYSAIEPVPTPDGMYIIPERCLSDVDLAAMKNTLQGFVKADNVQDIIDLPEVGQPVEVGRYYRYSGSMEDLGLVKSVVAHIREAKKPSELPESFSFSRQNAANLDWIPNEYVKPEYTRVKDNVNYQAKEEHVTAPEVAPEVAPDKWQVI